jgi:hypothetical protein
VAGVVDIERTITKTNQYILVAVGVISNEFKMNFFYNLRKRNFLGCREMTIHERPTRTKLPNLGIWTGCGTNIDGDPCFGVPHIT